MTEPTKEEIEAVFPTYGNVDWETLKRAVSLALGCEWFDNKNFFVGHQDAGINMNSLNRIVSAFLIAAHAARPVPATALEIVEKVREQYEDGLLFYLSADEAASLIAAAIDAARAEDRALIEEAARDIDALLLTPEISDCDPRDKDTETQVVERNARATLAKLRSYGNAN